MQKIVVVGAGTMGAGIAFVAARAGYAVDVIEPDSPTRERASSRIAADAERTGVRDAFRRVTLYADLPSGLSAGIAIEAVPERLDLKREVFRKLSSALGPDAILATNTSSLSVTEIAEGLPSPERVVGLHFFNPPPAMKLVEIVRTDVTTDDAIESARAFVERCEKTPVVTADTPGFIVNRVARPFYLQAMHAYERGVAPLDDIDALLRGIGFRMGPFELMDLIGLDVNLATTESVYERTGDERLAPVQLQRDMVARGLCGRKTKQGFYDYRDGVPQHDDTPPQPPEELDEDEHVVVVGFGASAYEFRELLAQGYAHVEHVENDDLLDEIAMNATIVVDAGDGLGDRADVVRELDTLLPPETVIFVNAYGTDVDRLANDVRHPQRVVGYGVLGTLVGQRVIEIVDAEATDDDALELAQELFARIGKRAILVENVAGLVLGRIVGSVIDEAVRTVQSGVADADDVDLAMRLGTNYPIGPIAWGREIGGARVSRILHRLAEAEGKQYEPHRSLWVLDVETDTDAEQATQSESGNAIFGANLDA